jgi:membrane protein involved in colicin uptake
VSSIKSKTGARGTATLRSPEAAFDMWLDRRLREMCESVAAEPLPDELLRLVNADRASADRASADRASADRASADRASADRASADRASADRASAGPPPAEDPAPSAGPKPGGR